MKCLREHPVHKPYPRGWPALAGCLTACIFLLAAIGFATASGQDQGSPRPSEPSRFKQVGDLLNQLKKLRTDLGAGHPRVQEIVRNLKLLEEELRMEQSFFERLAAQLKTAESELRERQVSDWEKSQAVNSIIRQQAEGQVPSLETLELLERQAQTELQRIDWELASEGPSVAAADRPQLYQADELRLKALQLTRDLVQLKLGAAREQHANSTGRSPAAFAQDKLAVQVLSLELSIAEANAQAAEIDLTLKKQIAKSLPAEKINSLNERRAAVTAQLRSLPAKKELARQHAQSEQSSDQYSQQIRELEMQRIQNHSRSVELQALLDVVDQALSPQAPARSAPKAIN